MDIISAEDFLGVLMLRSNIHVDYKNRGSWVSSGFCDKKQGAQDRS